MWPGEGIWKSVKSWWNSPSGNYGTAVQRVAAQSFSASDMPKPETKGEALMMSMAAAAYNTGHSASGNLKIRGRANAVASGGHEGGSEPTTTLHRGVNSKSPAFKNVEKGIAKPRGGNATALEHNTKTTESNFTSWSTNLEVAENFALRGSGEGVVLTAEIPNSKLETSPNIWEVQLIQNGKIVSESEVLVKGKVTNASTKKVKLEGN